MAKRPEAAISERLIFFSSSVRIRRFLSQILD
jgi:hypothetical protein